MEPTSCTVASPVFNRGVQDGHNAARLLENGTITPYNLKLYSGSQEYRTGLAAGTSQYVQERLLDLSRQGAAFDSTAATSQASLTASIPYGQQIAQSRAVTLNLYRVAHNRTTVFDYELRVSGEFVHSGLADSDQRPLYKGSMMVAAWLTIRELCQHAHVLAWPDLYHPEDAAQVRKPYTMAAQHALASLASGPAGYVELSVLLTAWQKCDWLRDPVTAAI